MTAFCDKLFNFTDVGNRGTAARVNRLIAVGKVNRVVQSMAPHLAAPNEPIQILEVTKITFSAAR
jgi:hypothetical protein